MDRTGRQDIAGARTSGQWHGKDVWSMRKQTIARLARLFSALLTVIVASAAIAHTTAAFASEDAASASTGRFTIRNGINFGDTIDVVKEKEELELSSILGDDSWIGSEDTVIFDIPGSSVSYKFDDNGKLNECQFYFNIHNADLDQLMRDYDLIEEIFEREYGEHYSSKDGGTDYVKPEAYGVDAIWYSQYEYEMNETMKTSDLYTYVYSISRNNIYNQWILKDDFGTIVIEQGGFLYPKGGFLYPATDDGVEKRAKHVVNYYYYSNEQLAKLETEQ